MVQTHPQLLALLPGHFDGRDGLVRLLKAEGYVAVDERALSQVDVAVVALFHVQGPVWAQKALQRRLSVVLLTDDGQVPAPEGWADFVDKPQWWQLPARLKWVQNRHDTMFDARQRQRQQSLLLQLTADYAEANDIQDILHDVTFRLAQEMGIDRASVVLLDEDRISAHVLAASDDAALKDLRIELKNYPEIREVVRTQAPVIIEDAPTHPLLAGVQGVDRIHMIAALPLSTQGKLLGVLLLRVNDKRAAFSSRDIEFLATVGHATAVALRNARRLERIRGQRLAAEEKAAALKRYEDYFSHLSDGVAILDEKRSVVSMNPAGLRLLELSLERAQNAHLYSLIQPEDEQRFEDLVQAALRNESRHQSDLKVRTVMGKGLILSVAVGALEIHGASVIVSFRDVTHTRLLADELRQTKEFLERLIDSSVDGIIAANMKGHVILFNKGAEAMLGYTAMEALSSLSTWHLYPDDGAREIMARLRSNEFGGKGRLHSTRMDILTKDKERVPVNMTASILYEGDSEVATVGIFTDLRAQVLLERKLTDAQSRLQQSEKNAVLVALAGTTAHELNQPLTSVMGWAEWLKRKAKADTHRDFFQAVDVIYREAERMAEIVRKIGRITRFETKNYVGESQIVDLEKATTREE